MAHWTKVQIFKIITDKREFEFVDSLKEVEEYYALKKFGIAKSSIDLKELLDEGKFPINNEISNLQKGYYYIIDIKPQTTQFKSKDKTVNIAYALFRELQSSPYTYGNTVYQINVNSLIDGTAQPISTNDESINIADLIGKVITITRIREGDEEIKSRQAVFSTTQIATTVEDVKLFNVPLSKEDINLDFQIVQWEFEQENKSQYQSQVNVMDFWDEDPAMYMDI